MHLYEHFLVRTDLGITKQKRSQAVLEAFNVFIAGITGVFLGMALLYFTIKIMAAVAGRFSPEEGSK